MCLRGGGGGGGGRGCTLFWVYWDLAGVDRDWIGLGCGLLLGLFLWAFRVAVFFLGAMVFPPFFCFFAFVFLGA